MRSHYQTIVRLAESFVPFICKAQQTNPQKRHYGGCILPGKGYSEPMSASACIDVLISLYFNEDSHYFRDDVIWQHAVMYMDYLQREQHADGTFDLLETNFHDATAIAFSIQVLAFTYKLLQKKSLTDQEKQLEQKFLELFAGAAKGMTSGGFHTPNHRWVMASALSLLYNILRDQTLYEEAQLYLHEGIDCDEEGNYTERSTGIYDVVNNNSLIIIARELDMPELLEHVSRNLDKVCCYIEPDYSLLTDISKRQDKDKNIYPYNHYWAFCFMAHYQDNAIYAWVADEIMQLISARTAGKAEPVYASVQEFGFSNLLSKFMLNQSMITLEPAMKEYDKSFEKWYKKAGLVRKRCGNVSMTIMQDNQAFLKFQKGMNTLYVKLAASFFARGQFRPQAIEKTANGYRLQYNIEHGYVRPLPENPGTTIWHEIKHENRKTANLQQFFITADIELHDDYVNLILTYKGTVNVPYRLEFDLLPGGMLDTEQLRMEGNRGGAVILKKDRAAYTFNYDTIAIESGGQETWEHDYTTTMRGADSQSPEKFSVYMTGFTPVNHLIKIY